MVSIRCLGIAVATLVFMGGCESMPTVTRSGDVKDIIIGDNLSAGETTVSPGDEVRWINKRTAPVRVVFLDPVSDKQFSCKSNFGGLMAPNSTAKLDTNEAASVCFRDPGYVRYTVRMKSADTTGELNVPGVIKVGAQSTGQTSDTNNTAQSRGEMSGTNGQPTDPKSEPSSSTSTTTTTTTTTMPAK